MLFHRQQTALHGCLYHAAYALTGDGSLLAHVDDISTPRFYARLHALGLMVVALHAGPPAPPEFWAGQPPGEHLYLLSIASRHLGDVEHAVAVSVCPGVGATVSDSRDPAPRDLDWPAFLASEYAPARRVEVLAPADVDAYPAEDGAALVARALAASRPDPHPHLTL